MSLRNFRFSGLASAEPDGIIRLDRAEETHLFRVLRAKPGEMVGLLDGHGLSGRARVEAGGFLTLLEKKETPAPEKRIHLYIAPPRRQKMDSILRQAAELGVYRIVPVICEYAVSEPDGDSVAGRWTDVLMEACKQSSNPLPPIPEAPIVFRRALEDAEKNCGKLFYGSVEESGKTPEIPEKGDFAWFVGPEGGYAPEELAELKRKAEPLKLGGWILRVETAAVAGIAKLI